MPSPEDHLKSVRDYKIRINTLFAFLESESVLEMLSEWSQTDRKSDPIAFFKSRGVNVPPGVAISAISDMCSNLCIGAWCPLHFTFAEGIGIGRCE